MVAKSLLLVEDEVIIRMLLRSDLIASGVPVIFEASSGEDAVEIARRERPDIVCMDIKLRGAIDGIEAARRINAFAGIPVIFMTAYNDALALAGGLPGVNVAGIIDKPVTLGDLIRAIASASPADSGDER